MADAHVFISYSHADRDYVAQLAERLEAAGIPAWFDRQLQGGFSWSHQLEDKIRSARAVLVVMSPASSHSEYVRDEIHFAKETAGIPLIVPLMREDCDLPLPLTGRQWLDARGPRGLSAEIVAEISALYNDPQNWSGRSPLDLLPTAHTSRRTIAIASLLVLAVAAIVVACWIAANRDNEPTAAPKNERPIVVLMDSTIPRVVYDDQTRATGGSNADDISNMLKDLPIQIIKETTSLEWNRDEQVRQINPHLIVMHLSCFYSETNIDDSDRKFWTFIESMQDTRAKFIVYSRGLPTDPDPYTAQRWNAFVERLESQFSDRVHLMVVGREHPSFRHVVTARDLKNQVKATLRLP